MTTFFPHRVVTVIIFGAMGIGETIAFAPDFTKAKFAAAKMFALFDRIPPIDVASTAGSVIVSLGRIQTLPMMSYSVICAI